MASRTFVGARVMETFAHGTDVADALEVPFLTGGALRHVAALGVKTFGWSFQNRGLAVPDHRVRVELTDPDGEVHRWNENDTQSVVGTLEDFSLVVTQRRHIDDTGLVVDGPTARQWMEIAQCFAGPPGSGRQPARRDSRGDSADGLEVDLASSSRRAATRRPRWGRLSSSDKGCPAGEQTGCRRDPIRHQPVYQHRGKTGLGIDAKRRQCPDQTGFDQPYPARRSGQAADQLGEAICGQQGRHG